MGFLKVVRQARFTARLFTSPVRRLPDYLIIGTQKGGTSTLYHLLIQHPAIAPAFEKEVHFFDEHYDKGTLWYRANFPSRPEDWLANAAGRRLISGEASPSYLYDPAVPERLFRLVPNAKLIVLLRDPADRAFSHYQHNRRRGHCEPLSFEEAIAREPQRLGGKTNRLYSYLARGLYGEQLERWMRYFPREHFLVLKSEDLFTSPDTVWHQTLAFLGLPGFQIQRYERFNKGVYNEKMAPETRRRLSDYFAAYNRRLYELVGRDFEWER